MSDPADDVTKEADPFSEMLAAYDEALAGGDLATPEPGATLPPDVRARMQEACACLRLLERAYPRARSAPPADPARRVGFQPVRSGPTDRLKTYPTGPDGPAQFGRFELVRELGRGGHGIVLLARDPVLGRDVAVKVLRPEYHLTPEMRRRFLREARAAAALDHPHIIPVYEAGEEGPVVYIASAYCDGPTLAQWLAARASPVPERAAARLVQSLAEGVAHAHAHGILHRDLKPANVLLAPRPPTEAAPGDGLEFVPRLTDFGLAKFFEPGPAEAAGEDEATNPVAEGYESAAARAGSGEISVSTVGIVGTPAYMAPEQLRGEPPSPATDVWALGVILFQLLAGKPPFAAASRAELARQVLDGPTPSPRHLRRDLDPALAAVCLRCLEKDPARRYDSAQALADVLTRWLRGGPLLSRPLRLARRRPLAAWILAILLAAAAAAVAVALWPPDPDRPLHVIQKELAAADAVTLVGDTGVPPWYRWRTTEGGSTAALDRDQVLVLQSQAYGLLELVPDPLHDSYRFSAEVRHDRSDAFFGEVGLYFAYANRDTPPGLEHCYGAVMFHDRMDLSLLPGAGASPRGHNPVDLMAQLVGEPNMHVANAHVGSSLYFIPNQQETPAAWRSLAIEVRPDRVRALWQGEAITEVTVPALGREFGSLRAGAPAAGPATPRFTPRGGLGLYVYRSSASFRRVRLQPLEDTP